MTIDLLPDASSRSRRPEPMNRKLFTSLPLLLFALAILVPAMALAGPSQEETSTGFGLPQAPDETPVRARLIAESGAVAPGSTVWLGVHLDQDEGWHTYWKNAGDAGLPTEVEWDLPEGYSVGELQWPAPHRYVEAGDLITYGYEGHALLLAELTVPASAAPGPARIGAEVDWLMCKDLCVPGSGSVELTLEIGGDPTPLPESDAALFAEARSRLPRPSVPGLEVEQALEFTPLPAGQRAHVALAVEGLSDPAATEWTWFPEYHEQLFTGEAAARIEGGRLLLAVPLTVAAEAEPGPVDWAGVLELDHPGEDPVFLRVPVSFEVAAAGAAVESDATGLVATALGATNGVAPARAAGGSLFYYLLLALVGGVILNVMPCVLPVLSLKVMSFVHHAGQDRAVQFRLGLMFTAGVLASFLALALVVIGLQAAGNLVGWGFQFQNPVFVVVMAAVVFAFGLSLFGVYEIILPVQIGAGTGGGSAYAESFLNGVLATALATPCTAPLLGSALGFAFSQPAVVVLAIFLTTGLGLSLPYLLLSLNPGWLRFVPKPGPWMNRFKQCMGFLLMATLIWLLWVLGQQVGLDAMASVMAFLLVLGFALWLYGTALTLSSSTARRSVVWAVVLVLVVGAWVRFVNGEVGPEVVAAHAGQAGHGDARAFSVETLQAEVAAGNTVFIDFTAAWCMTCKVNEKTVIQSDEVQQTLSDLGVVTLVGDWTNRDETITRVLRQYGRSGVPFYAVFPAGRIDDVIVLPEVITRSLLIEALEQAGPSQPVASR